jgi:hypothetical protein
MHIDRTAFLRLLPYFEKFACANGLSCDFTNYHDEPQIILRWNRADLVNVLITASPSPAANSIELRALCAFRHSDLSNTILLESTASYEDCSHQLNEQLAWASGVQEPYNRFLPAVVVARMQLKSDPKVGTRMRAISTIVDRHGVKSLPEICEVLKNDADEILRCVALRAICKWVNEGKLSPADARSIVTEAASDSSDNVRKIATTEMARHGW